MSTRSVVATGTVEGWKGRYVHFDGYPTGVGESVRQIVPRDGVETTVWNLIHDNYGWSSVDAEFGKELDEFLRDGRFVRVDGYGVAYTTEQGQSSPDDWQTDSNADPLWIEWVYLIQDEGIVVLKGDYENKCFREVGTVKYHDAEGMGHIESAVYSMA